MVGRDDLGGRFQPRWLCERMIKARHALATSLCYSTEGA